VASVANSRFMHTTVTKCHKEPLENEFITHTQSLDTKCKYQSSMHSNGSHPCLLQFVLHKWMSLQIRPADECRPTCPLLVRECDLSQMTNTSNQLRTRTTVTICAQPIAAKNDKPTRGWIRQRRYVDTWHVIALLLSIVSPCWQTPTIWVNSHRQTWNPKIVLLDERSNSLFLPIHDRSFHRWIPIWSYKLKLTNRKKYSSLRLAKIGFFCRATLLTTQMDKELKSVPLDIEYTGCKVLSSHLILIQIFNMVMLVSNAVSTCASACSRSASIIV